MKMCSVSCEQFTAPVIKPLVIGGELITSRNCARVILNSADGSRFIGEMSPLPHFNNETFAQAFLQLSHFYPSLSQLSFPESLEKLSLFAKKHLTQLYPSVRNAIEMACFSYIESLKDYIKIYTDREKPILTLSSFKSFEQKLGSSRFIRVHKSYIVALKHIYSVQRNRIVIGEKWIPIGLNYKEKFLKKIES